MDTLWLFILQATQAVMSALDTALAPVNAVHPVLSIMLLALCTLFLTRFLRKHIVTKRYLRLQEEFHHWYNVRQEALSAHSDPHKAKSLAQNIDKATLNKVYYDYFFEGLLLNLVTTYLPILCVAGYINEAFKPERLEQLIGHQSLLVFTSPNSVAISPLAWFMLCLVGFWLGKIALSKIKVQIRNRQAEQQAV